MNKEAILDIAHCPVSELAPLHPELLKSPWMLNQRLQEEAPVFLDASSGIYFVSRYEDVVQMAMDHETFSSKMLSRRSMAASEDPEIQETLANGYPQVDTMLTEDPPLQRRYRKFVDSAFSPASLKSIEPFIEQTAHTLIDSFIDEGQCEFLSTFGVPLPLRVIASQLGAPLSDLELFRKWTQAFIGNLSQQLDRDGLLQAAKDMVEFQHYFVERMQERRAVPTDDILSKIVNASIDDEHPLTDAECLSMISQILVAGNETTASAFTEGIWQLIRNPDQYALLRQDISPAMISRLVEETLRVSSPSSNMFRRATKDLVLHGVSIPENSILFARFASANQDPGRFPDPHRFDLMRDNLKEQVAFGRGVHHCLGAALSRREMNLGFRVLLERLENFRLVPGAPEPEYAPNALLHGLTGLQLAFDRRN